MNEPVTRNEETTEPPGEGEDTTAYMRELRDYRGETSQSGPEGSTEGPKDIDWDPSKGIGFHPFFWFIWEMTPGTDNGRFLECLHALMAEDWVLDAQVEKSSDGASMIVARGDRLVYFEVHQDVGALVISNKAGEPILELTARKWGGDTCCFSTILCNRKLMNGPICMNPALPGTTKCAGHSIKDGRPPGQRRLAVTSVDTGVNCLPADAMYFWSNKKPEIAQFIKDLAESFRLKLNWDVSHPLMDELRYVAVQMVTRNLMHNKAIEADFKSAVHDPDTGNVVAFKAHYLLDKVTTFDARIQQKLKDFGLLVPPSRTEEPHRIPVELEFLWTPVKRVPAIDVRATEIDETAKDKKEVAGYGGHEEPDSGPG